MRSGGYSVSKDITRIQQDTIIFWGADDEILGKGDVKRFAEDLPHSRWVSDSNSKCHLALHFMQPEHT